MLEISNLGYAYSKSNPIIGDLSLKLYPGTVCGLLGKNGTGKSTLIYLISGLLKPQQGSIKYKGFTPLDRKTGFLEDIFLVPEEFSLPSIPYNDYIKANAPFYPKFRYEDLLKYLDMFDMKMNINLGQLSMGQRKKAFIAFAMACNTSLLLLDEPTNGLDISSKRSFRKSITECVTDDKIILISTHQVYDIDKILDHVVIMDRDGILLDSSLARISEKYKFNFTTDRVRAHKAIISLDVPGGYNIAEPLTDPNEETDVNLETLFEMVTNGLMKNSINDDFTKNFEL